MQQGQPRQISRRFVAQADQLAKLGRLEEALHLCEDGVQAHKAFVPGWYLLARLLLESEETEKAGTWIQKLCSEHPKHMGAQALLIKWKALDQTKVSKAQPDPSERPELPGLKDLQGLLDLGAGLSSSPRSGPSRLEASEEVSTRDSGFELVSETLADLYAKQGDVAGAREMYNNLLKTGVNERTVRQKLRALEGEEIEKKDGRVQALKSWLTSFESET